MEEQRHTGVAAKGVIWDGARVLLLRRALGDRSMPGAWEFPGGKLEFGEELEVCLLREIREEAGIGAEPERILYAASFFACPNRQSVILTYLCRPLAREVTLSGEHSEYHWATPKEMRAMLAPDIEEDLEKYGIYDLLATIKR